MLNFSNLDKHLYYHHELRPKKAKKKLFPNPIETLPLFKGECPLGRGGLKQKQGPLALAPLRPCVLAFEIPVKQFLLFIVKAVNPIKISVHVQKMRLHDLYAQY